MGTENTLKIFLVDDDSFCRSTYRQFLANKGCSDIQEFGSGPDCLDHLYQQPDIIFLDHGMDPLTGLDVLKKLRISNPDAYVVFISGQANITTAVKALKLGAIDYIAKGVNELENIANVLDTITPLIIKRNIKRMLVSQS